MKTKYIYFFIIILLVAAVLRFWDLGGVELQSDSAHYAMRALGWLDFLTGVGQTSPIVWFGSVPWWANLSFHDHPPLVFLSQFISFKIFGDNTFAALLPHVVASLAFLALGYWFLRRVKNTESALLFVFFTAISSYATWAARTGYLEGVQVFFILASLVLFVLYLNQPKPVYLFLWAMALAFSMLSKYTSVFLPFAAVAYCLLWRRSIFKKKEFWLAILLFVVLLAPVFYYNFMIFKTRGHFDAAVSSLVGMQPEDFFVIANRSAGGNHLAKVWGAFLVLKDSNSWPVFAITLLSFLYLFYKVVRKQAGNLEKFLVVNFITLLVMVAFLGASDRYLVIMLPLMLPAIAVCIYEFLIATQYTKKIHVAVIIFLIVTAGWELTYNLNTNLLVNPYGRRGVIYSSSKFNHNGFVELERYLRTTVIKELPPLTRVTDIKTLKETSINTDYMVLFDERADWFSTMWYLNRYNFYYNIPFLHLSDFFNSAIDPKISPFQYYASKGIKRYWFIESVTEDNLMAKGENYLETVKQLETELKALSIKPTREFFDSKGRPTLRVYYFEINN